MDEIIAKLEEFVIEKMATSRTPGVVVGLYRGKESLWLRGFGTEDLTRQTAVTPDSLFCISSLSKMFTAIAVLQLAERSLIRLDDPVERYLPIRLRAYDLPITFHHLLSHTSGYPCLGLSNASILSTYGKSIKHPMRSWDDFFAFLRGIDDWALAKPGERFFYWNEGYEILGYLVAKVSESDFERYLRSNVLEPLGMERTRLSHRGERSTAGLATPHRITNEGNVVSDSIPGYQGCSASGGILTCAREMGLLFATLVEEEGAPQILSSESLRLMNTAHVKENASEIGQQYYGYGTYSVRVKASTDYWGHGGSIGTSHTDFRYNRTTRQGAFVSGNGAFPAALLSWYALSLLDGGDPDSHPAFRAITVAKRIAGVYSGFRDVSFVEVQVAWPQIEVIERGTGFRTRMTAYALDDDLVRCRVFVGLDKYLEAEFRLQSGSVDLILERRLLRKRV
jgi:CubicO group peptidase (beta-lactamase class C family)